MKKRTTQLLSLMISAAMIASTPCLTYAADFNSETLLSDSEESSEDFSEEIPSTDPSSSEQSPATADADSTSESTSIPDDASSSDEITLSDNDVNSESILSEDAEELSESPSEDFSESTDEDEELFMDDQDPDFSDGNSDGQELGGAVDSNEYHTLSASANNISDNRYAQNYINYSNVICSNLMADGNGYIRVEADDSGLQCAGLRRAVRRADADGAVVPCVLYHHGPGASALGGLAADPCGAGASRLPGPGLRHHHFQPDDQVPRSHDSGDLRRAAVDVCDADRLSALAAGRREDEDDPAAQSSYRAGRGLPLRCAGAGNGHAAVPGAERSRYDSGGRDWRDDL